jgi:hypothetical protein
MPENAWVIDSFQIVSSPDSQKVTQRLEPCCAESLAMSAGLSASHQQTFSTTNSCIHKILHDKCLKRPTPLQERTPLAADESRYKHMK